MTNKRLRLKHSPILKEQFWGVCGELIEEKEHFPALEAPYKMFTVRLDKEIETNGVDGRLKHTIVCLPDTMFEDCSL